MMRCMRDAARRCNTWRTIEQVIAFGQNDIDHCPQWRKARIRGLQWSQVITRVASLVADTANNIKDTPRIPCKSCFGMSKCQKAGCALICKAMLPSVQSVQKKANPRNPGIDEARRKAAQTSSALVESAAMSASQPGPTPSIAAYPNHHHKKGSAARVVHCMTTKSRRGRAAGMAEAAAAHTRDRQL